MSVRALFAAAVLLWAAAADAAPRPLRAAPPDLPKRWALEATLSQAAFDGTSVAAGVRARVRDDPFQFELSFDQDFTDRAQPDFRWLALGGGGFVRELAPRWTVYGAFLLGAFGVDLVDADQVGTTSKYGPAVGVRATIVRRLPALRLLSFEPTLGLGATVLFAGTGHNDSAGERISWGGPSALLTVSLGGETLGAASSIVPRG